ncbi:MAG: ACP S-malonyltransferase [Moraxella sp.]|nr:ACP S-malonyltransferase [Moraxella sp.]
MTEIQKTPRFALLFPGQGSQTVGMMADWAEDTKVKQTFVEASDALGLDMWALLSEERLNETQYTQPALLTASIALWRVLEERLPTPPLYLAGHSLGEYSALCAAGVISLGDAVTLVHERGKLMVEAVAGMDTQMAAVLGLEDAQVADLCERATEEVGIVNPANFNSQGQVVIAGTALGVTHVLAEVQALGKKAVPLKVSVPSHCALMKPASERLGRLLVETKFNVPNIPVIQNRHARVENAICDIKTALMEQLSEPVQWTKTMQKLADKQVDFVVECGYGNVLANLAKRQSVVLPAFGTDKPAKLEKLMEQFV